MARYDWVEDKIHRRKMAREAARSVLPNATEVKIVASANVRAWRTMLELRLGEGAELEIRRMAVACLRLLQQEAPALFGDFEIYPSPDRSEAGTRGVSQGVRRFAREWRTSPESEGIRWVVRARLERPRMLPTPLRMTTTRSPTRRTNFFQKTIVRAKTFS